MSNAEKTTNGGKRKGAGRPLGSKNDRAKLKEELSVRVKDLASGYSESAILTLAEICADPDVPPAQRISAANSILDRSIGKPVQQSEVSHKGNVSLIHILDQIRAKGVDLNDVD